MLIFLEVEGGNTIVGNEEDTLSMNVFTEECGGLRVGKVRSNVDGVISAVGEVDFDSVVGSGGFLLGWRGGDGKAAAAAGGRT